MRKLQVHDEAVTALGVVAYAVQFGEAGGYLPAGGNAGLAVAPVADNAHGVHPPAKHNDKGALLSIGQQVLCVSPAGGQATGGFSVCWAKPTRAAVGCLGAYAVA